MSLYGGLGQTEPFDPQAILGLPGGGGSSYYAETGYDPTQSGLTTAQVNQTLQAGALLNAITPIPGPPINSPASISGTTWLLIIGGIGAFFVLLNAGGGRRR